MRYHPCPALPRAQLRLVAALAASVLLLVAPACAQEEMPGAADLPPARARAAELVAVINGGDRATARSFVQRSFADGFRDRMPVRQHLDVVSRLHTESGRLHVERVSDAGAHRAELLLRNELTGGWMTASIEVEPGAPHRIAGLGFRPAPPPAGAAPALPQTDSGRVRHLDQLVRRLAEAGAFSGAVLLAKDGTPLFTAAYGTADRATGRAIDLDTRFNIASMNKMVTAVAIAQLVEAGELSFSDPISRLLPGFMAPEFADRLRVEHLLSHTGGTGDYVRQLGGSCARTVDEMLTLATDRSLGFEPGTRWRYSNTGFLLLGKIVEQVTGQSYYDYVREHVYAPAGMVSTDSYETDRLPPNTAIGYDREYDGGPDAYRANTDALGCRGGPAGGGYSTVRDLFRFAETLRAGTLIGPSTVRLLTTPKPLLASPGYGFGFTVDPARGVVGHSGGYRGITANLDIFMGGGYTAVVLSNHGGAGFPIVERIRELVPKPRAEGGRP